MATHDISICMIFIQNAFCLPIDLLQSSPVSAEIYVFKIKATMYFPTNT
jgi:hypothetical protein